MTEIRTTPAASPRSSARRRSWRRAAGYGGALAMTPYLLIKISWVIGILLGELRLGPELDRAGWIVLNTVTIVMAAAGIGVSLALAGAAGRALPDPVLLVLAWLGVGFLVPMLPFLILSSVLGTGGDPDTTSMPGWEAWLIQLSFAGLGLALAVALPLQVLERWPAALTGRLGDGAARTVDGRRAWLGPLATGYAATFGALALYWSAGGPAGLAHPAAADLTWRLLTGNAAAWALIGALATWMLSRRRPVRLPRWLPMILVWATSGFLLAWNCWKLPFALVLTLTRSPAGDEWPEHLALAAAQCVVGVLAGAAMLATLLLNRPSEPAVPAPTHD
jgi:hypothetical protein